MLCQWQEWQKDFLWYGQAHRVGVVPLKCCLVQTVEAVSLFSDKECWDQLATSAVGVW